MPEDPSYNRGRKYQKPLLSSSRAEKELLRRLSRGSRMRSYAHYAHRDENKIFNDTNSERNSHNIASNDSEFVVD